MYCKICGARMDPGCAFCSSCGAPAGPAPDAPPTVKPSTSRTAPVLNAVLAFVLALAWSAACALAGRLLAGFFMGETAARSIAPVPLVFIILFLHLPAVPCIILSALRPRLVLPVGGGIAVASVLLWLFVPTVFLGQLGMSPELYSLMVPFSRLAVPSASVLFVSLCLFNTRRRAAVWALSVFGGCLALFLALALFLVMAVHLGIVGVALAFLLPTLPAAVLSVIVYCIGTGQGG